MPIDDNILGQQISKENWKLVASMQPRLEHITFCNPIEWTDSDLILIRGILHMVMGDLLLYHEH